MSPVSVSHVETQTALTNPTFLFVNENAQILAFQYFKKERSLEKWGYSPAPKNTEIDDIEMGSIPKSLQSFSIDPNLTTIQVASSTQPISRMDNHFMLYTDDILESITQDEEKLDWDTFIADPPYRPGGTLRVRLNFKGREKPIF